VNDDYYEDLTVAGTEALLDALAKCEKPPTGPMSGRLASEPLPALTSLTEKPTGPGFGCRKDL